LGRRVSVKGGEDTKEGEENAGDLSTSFISRFEGRKPRGIGDVCAIVQRGKRKRRNEFILIGQISG